MYDAVRTAQDVRTGGTTRRDSAAAVTDQDRGSCTTSLTKLWISRKSPYKTADTKIPSEMIAIGPSGRPVAGLPCRMPSTYQQTATAGTPVRSARWVRSLVRSTPVRCCAGPSCAAHGPRCPAEQVQAMTGFGAVRAESSMTRSSGLVDWCRPMCTSRVGPGRTVRSQVRPRLATSGTARQASCAVTVPVGNVPAWKVSPTKPASSGPSLIYCGVTTGATSTGE